MSPTPFPHRRAALTVWLLTPFIAIAAAIADGDIGHITVAISFGVATGGTFLVPRLIDESIGRCSASEFTWPCSHRP